MTDIFQEVDEDLKREEYARLWRRYGGLILAACAAVVLVSGGMVAWRGYQDHVRQAASLKFQEIVHAGENKAPPLSADGAKALDAIAPSLTPGYRLLAMFDRAGALVSSKDYDQAVRIFDAIAKDGSAPQALRDIATLKSAYLQADTMTLTDMRERIGTLAAPESAFRFSANELLGYVAYRIGDFKSARDYFQAILADPVAPDSLRLRGQDMAGLIASRLPATAVPATIKAPEPAQPSSSPAPSPPAPANH